MRIICPFCGERDLTEFSYLGDAAYQRPSPETADIEQAFYEAVYLRENPAGQHVELWYHASGCRSWLRVWRDTVTHEIFGAQLAREVVEA